MKNLYTFLDLNDLKNSTTTVNGYQNVSWSLSPLAPLAAQKESPAQKIKRQRAGWLTQEDIDRLDKPTISWLDDCPGGISTLILLACFVVGMWGAWLLWKLK